jgi:polyphosphate kinase 2 (PPK2 family)
MNNTKRFRIEPGSKVDLKNIDPGFHGSHAGPVEAAAELQHHLQRITKLQRALYADRSHSLLIVLQGIDGAGKDGTCWHVISAMNPLGINVTAFKQPTEEERDHDFLWRVHPHAPGRGRVAIFNRSHYEDVLVVRVHKLAVSSIIADALETMNIQMPKPTVDIEQIRMLYHRAEETENKKAGKKKKESEDKAGVPAMPAPPSVRT